MLNCCHQPPACQDTSASLTLLLLLLPCLCLLLQHSCQQRCTPSLPLHARRLTICNPFCLLRQLVA
jgi:hypothetical protein